MDLPTAVGLVALALFIGVYGTIIGAGGGFLLVPALAVLFGLDAAQAVGTGALTLALIRVSGAVGYHRQGLIVWPVAAWFALGAGPVALLSGWQLTDRIDKDAFLAIIGVSLLVLAALVVFQYSIRAVGDVGVSGSAPLMAPRKGLLLGGATLVGMLNGTFAVGGGLVAVPYLAKVQKLSAHRAAATTTAAVTAGSAAATLGHTLNGNVMWSFAPLLFLGAVVGSSIGARRARRLSEATVMGLLAGGLAIAGLPLVILG